MTPKGELTRPTADRVKEALFSIIQFDLPGAKVLDLFGGTGQLGIEALSRGANHAVFVDSREEACRLIKENLKRTKLESDAAVVRSDYLQYLQRCEEQFDIIFLDPPYKTNYIQKSVDLIIEKQLLNEDGIIVAETDELDKILTQIKNEKINIYDIRKYGRVDIIFLKRKG